MRWNPNDDGICFFQPLKALRARSQRQARPCNIPKDTKNQVKKFNKYHGSELSQPGTCSSKLTAVLSIRTSTHKLTGLRQETRSSIGTVIESEAERHARLVVLDERF
jgi:hypothetical protein